jgi:hypothetical protein
MVTDAELLAMASAFDVVPYDGHRRPRLIRVEKRSAAGKPPSWAIVSETGCNLSRECHWMIEPMNSNKTDEFFTDCRWGDLREAIGFAQDFLRQYPGGFKPLPDGLE